MKVKGKDGGQIEQEGIIRKYRAKVDRDRVVRVGGLKIKRKDTSSKLWKGNQAWSWSPVPTKVGINYI